MSRLFTPPRIFGPGESDWDTGYCGEFAIALKHYFPHLQLGVLGAKHGDGWNPEHFFAHDDAQMYDVTGARPLPASGDTLEVVTGYSNVAEFDADWGATEQGGLQKVEEAKTLIANNS